MFLCFLYNCNFSFSNKNEKTVLILNSSIKLLQIIKISNLIFASMSLNPLKRIIKSTLNRDPLEQIFWGNPTADTFTKVLNNYRSMPTQYRQQVIGRCLKKLSKGKQFDLTLANLVLIHKLMKMDYISLPSKQPEMQQNNKKKQINMAEKNFIKFYFMFMKNEEKKLQNKVNQMQEKIEYCQSALNNCLDIVKNSIIIQYCLSHSTNQLTLRMALKQIFQELRKDLEFTTNFVQTNAKLIYEQNNQTSFMINEIYQKLLFINKNLNKISLLIKKSGLSMNLPTYQLNRDLNMKIQMQMNMRRDEKIKFKTEKQIRSKRNIQLALNDEKQNNYDRSNYKGKNGLLGNKGVSQSLSQIDQDEILIQHDQLL